MSSPEHLLEAFKAAALSVTKLYKTAANAENRAHEDGYQDCLSDLLAFLDRENIGLGDGEGWKIRSWATEKLSSDADEEPALNQESAPVSVSPQPSPPPSTSAPPQPAHHDSMQISSPPPTQQTTTVEQDSQVETNSPQQSATTARFTPTPITVPTAERFTFQSSLAYPDINQLDLSDTPPAPRALRSRITTASGPGSRPNSTMSRRLGPGSGQKRRINLAELFDFDIGAGIKDNHKRSRHI